MVPTVRRKTTLFFVAIMAASLSAEATEIRLKSDVQVSGAIVLLGDVAEIRDNDTQRLATLQRMELFPAPSKTHNRVLRQREIRELLLLHGFNPRQLIVGGAQASRIRAKATSTSEARERSTPVAKPSILISRRALSRGEVIRAADVELREVESTPRNLSPILDPESAIGQEVTRSIPAGLALDLRYLKPPILVRRGQPVIVISSAAGVRIRTTARSLGEGALGELILLESIDSKGRFSARVTGFQKAEVYASSVPVSDTGWPEADVKRVSRRFQ